ncbi:hypothetical protein SprV_0702365400 [Sparganum proliferum]
MNNILDAQHDRSTPYKHCQPQSLVRVEPRSIEVLRFCFRLTAFDEDPYLGAACGGDNHLKKREHYCIFA